jgi:hypothetical protein
MTESEVLPDRLPVHPLVVGLTASAKLELPALQASYAAQAATSTAAALGEAAGAYGKASAELDAAGQELIDARRNTAEAEHKHATGGNERGIAQIDATEVEAAAELRLKRAEAEAGSKYPGATWPDNDDYDKFATEADQPHYRMVAGYLGGYVTGSGPDRQLLYLDARLSSWLQIVITDVALFSRVKDDSAAFGLRDVLWLNPDARVVRGDDSDSVQRSYLNGPFVRVADMEATFGSGGTVSRSSGLVCEAYTPGCCTKHTQRVP